ncbi:MAG: hypothetical protein WAV47_02565, partial [Blastocatellia bacterium]
EKTIYRIIYSGFFRWPTTRCIPLKIKVRPAGLEPATPCLEVRFQRIIENDEIPSNIELSDSMSYDWLTEACRKLLPFEDLTSYKIIYRGLVFG